MIKPEIRTSLFEGTVTFIMTVSIEEVFKNEENVELFRQMHKSGPPSACLVPMKQLIENIEQET